MVEVTESIGIPNTLVDLIKVRNNTLGDLRRLREFAIDLGRQPGELQLIDEMLDRIEHQRFTIAVVGEFNRGKSTFVNALLGEEILPADILPATATLNRVTYDLRPHVEIIYKATADRPEHSEEIAVDRLADYVTKLTADAQERAALIEQAVIHYNNRYLRQDVDIVDTPGLNDDDTMTAATLDIIPRADAAILVIMADSPFSGFEGDFLNNKLLLSDLGRVIFVVNAIDRVPVEDADRLLGTIRDRIKAAVKRKAEERFGSGSEARDERELYLKRIGEPRVFGLSALDALDGKLQGDEAMLTASHFPEFEAALDHFLTHDRGVVSLQSLAARVIDAGTRELQRLNQRIAAARMSKQEFSEAYAQSSTELDRLRQGLQEQFRRIEQTSEKTRQRIEPIVAQLGPELAAVAARTIDEAQISVHEISSKGQEALLARLGKEISAAADNVSRAVAERVQLTIQQEIELELGRVSEFATTVERGLQFIDLQFARPLSDDTMNVGLKGHAVRVAGHIGSNVGGNVAVLITSAVLTGAGIVFSLPVAMAVTFAVLLAGRFAGIKLSQRVVGNVRVDNFRRAYREAALLQLEQQIQAQYPVLLRQFEDHLIDTFTVFKRRVQGEMGGAVEEARQNLEEMRGQRERRETMSEVEIAGYERIEGELVKIVSKAHGLSGQLRDITEV